MTARTMPTTMSNPLLHAVPRIAALIVPTLMVVLASSNARAELTRHGEWPDAEKKISLDAKQVTKPDAIERIAKAANWNVVLHGVAPETIDVHVKDVAATRVLELVLGEAKYDARREGDLIDISPSPLGPVPHPNDAPPEASASTSEAAAAARAADSAPQPPASPGSYRRGRSEDRVVSGGSLRVEKGEVVDDVTVLGGSLEVLGEVEGDIAVVAGSVTVRDGAHVRGNANAIGGSLTLDEGAVVDGHVGVIGGTLKRAAGVHVGNASTSESSSSVAAGSPPPLVDKVHRGAGASLRHHVWEEFGNALSRTALLFVFGVVLLSLAGSRMARLKDELVLRPMRVFSLGVVALVVIPLCLAILCITIIGIPLAVLATLVLAFGAYAGVCVALTLLGHLMINSYSKNQHVHLAAGCAVLLILDALPGLGKVLHPLLAIVGIGVLVATRFAGYLPPKGAPWSNRSPYRS